MVENIIPYIGGEEEKSEKEPLRLWGKIEDGKIVPASDPVITCQCIRVPVLDGHTAAVFVNFEKKPTKEQIIEKWRSFKGVPQELNLPSAPKPVSYTHLLMRRLFHQIQQQKRLRQQRVQQKLHRQQLRKHRQQQKLHRQQLNQQKAQQRQLKRKQRVQMQQHHMIRQAFLIQVRIQISVRRKMQISRMQSMYHLQMKLLMQSVQLRLVM